jgi:starch synthase
MTCAASANKRVCKAALQARHGLPQDPDHPIIAMGSRLTHQKMADAAGDRAGAGHA